MGLTQTFQHCYGHKEIKTSPVEMEAVWFSQLPVLLHFFDALSSWLDAPRVQNAAHTIEVRVLRLAANTTARGKGKDWVEDAAPGRIWPCCNAQRAAGQAVLGKGWSTASGGGQ